MKKIYNILFIILVVLLLILRTLNWPNSIIEMNSDEIMTAINAESLARTGEDLNGIRNPIYLLGWGGQSVVLLYLMVLSIKIFGYSLFAVRLPSLLISIVAILVFYDFVKRLSKNNRIAKIGLIAILIAPWHILQSLWSADCNMFPHFLLFSMYILYRAITEKKYYLLYISMVFFALCLYCYGIAIYFVPLFLLIFSIYLLKNKYINPWQIIKCIIIFVFISWPIITMFAINLFKINISIEIFGFTIPYYESLSRTQDMLIFSDNILEQLINNIKSTFRIIFLQFDRGEWNSSIIFGTTYHISLFFIIIAIFNILWKKIKKKTKEENKLGNFMIILWFGISILTGLFINSANINRLNSIWYPMIILAIYGICITYSKIKYKKIYKISILCIYSILFISYIVYFNTYYFERVNNSGIFSGGFIEALNYVDTLEEKQDYMYTNIVEDGCLPLYVKHKEIQNNKKYISINSQEDLEQRIENIDNNDVIITKTQELEGINKNEEITIKEFGSCSVITK